MSFSYKDIVVTPNKGSSTDDPKIVFSGANTTVNTDIILRTYPTSNGALSFEGSAGQLFSITNDLTGTIFSVNDISGIPSIEVLDTGTIKFAQYSGNVVIGSATDANTGKLQVNGIIAANSFVSATYPIILNDISTQFDGYKTTFTLKQDQSVINNIIDSKDVDVSINGLRLTPYVDTYSYPWISVYDSINGFRVRTLPSNTSVSTTENILIIYNAPYIGDSASVILNRISLSRQTRRYPYAATTIALGD